jgi:hypothetical protein
MEGCARTPLLDSGHRASAADRASLESAAVVQGAVRLGLLSSL